MFYLSLFEYSTPAFVSVYGIVPLYIAEYSLVLFLHEIPQILYKDQLLAKMPVKKDNEAVFKKIGHKKLKENENISLPDEQKERLLKIINFMREVMNKMLSTET